MRPPLFRTIPTLRAGKRRKASTVILALCEICVICAPYSRSPPAWNRSCLSGSPVQLRPQNTNSGESLLDIKFIPSKDNKIFGVQRRIYLPCRILKIKGTRVKKLKTHNSNKKFYAKRQCCDNVKSDCLWDLSWHPMRDLGHGEQ